MAGFSKEQRGELRELFGEQVRRFDEQLDQRFTAQQTWLEARFEEERAYLRQLLKQELTDIRERLERLDKRADEDVRAALEDIAAVKKRLTRTESTLATLTAPAA